MNEEIKEILKDIEKGVKTGKDRNEIKVGGICYEWKDLKVLLDYITNLQQEKDTYKEQLRITHKDLRQYISRCEKAIEYIKNNWYELNTLDIEHCINLGKDIRIDILNILQNGGK